MGERTSGNYNTSNRRGSNRFESEGNETPKALRSVPEEQIPGIVDRYNAEATYNDWANHKAAGHLNELAQHIGNLVETSQHPLAIEAKNQVLQAHKVLSQAGFAAHPDILTKHVPAILDTLHNIVPEEMPEHATPHLNGAVNAGFDYMDTLHPAYQTNLREFGREQGKKSIKIEPEYRKNMFDYPGTRQSFADEPNMTKEEKGKFGGLAQMRQTADGTYALIKQGKIRDPEAGRTQESIDRKAAARKAARAAKTGAKLAAIEAEKKAGNQ